MKKVIPPLNAAHKHAIHKATIKKGISLNSFCQIHCTYQPYFNYTAQYTYKYCDLSHTFSSICDAEVSWASFHCSLLKSEENINQNNEYKHLHLKILN